jgi:hypothetical protein
MESAISVLNRSRSLERLEPQLQKLQRCWKRAVGERIARHSRVILLREQTVVVTVDDKTWKQQLHQMRSLLLNRLREVSGMESLTAIDFKVAVGRRLPKAETGPLFAVDPRSNDDADRIADPALRIIYKNSRRKAAG